MTINQLVLNTPNDQLIAVSFELEQFITHDTKESEISQQVSEISQALTKHLLFHRDQKAKNEQLRLEVERLAQEKNQKTTKSFSSFKNQTVKKVTQNQHTIEQALPVLIAMGKVANSYLPNVYRFPGSPYAYTVNGNKWSSPLGQEGEGLDSFLSDISHRIFSYNEQQKQNFVNSVTSQLS